MTKKPEWRWVAGGIQRSADNRFEITAHNKGFSVYDHDRGSAIARDFISWSAAKAATVAVRKGAKFRYEFDD